MGHAVSFRSLVIIVVLLGIRIPSVYGNSFSIVLPGGKCKCSFIPYPGRECSGRAYAQQKTTTASGLVWAGMLLVLEE